MPALMAWVLQLCFPFHAKSFPRGNQHKGSGTLQLQCQLPGQAPYHHAIEPSLVVSRNLAMPQLHKSWAFVYPKNPSGHKR